MKLKILEGTKLFDQAGTCLGALELAEGERSEPMIIIETAEFSDLREIKLTDSEQDHLRSLSEAKAPGVILALDGRFQHADLKNANKRMYPNKLWDKVLAPAGKWAKRLQENKMLGECDHPSDGQTMLSRVSHLITKLYRNPDNPKEIRGRLVVFDTPQGRILKAIHEGGGRLGVSSRGKGSVVRHDGVDLVQEDYDLDTFDAVHNPSTPDAYPAVVSESTQAQVRQENTEMNRLQDLTERLARLQKREVGGLDEGALDVISEEVDSITTILTTEAFGEEAPKAAALAFDAKDFSRDLKERKKELTEMADKKKGGTDILGKPGKPTSGVPASEPKTNMLGLKALKVETDCDCGKDDCDACNEKKKKDEAAKAVEAEAAKNESFLNEPSFVKDKGDEKLWGKAKRAAGHADAKEPYAFANWFFHKQKNEATELVFPRPEDAESVKRLVECLDSEVVGEEAVLKDLAKEYRGLFDIEGRLSEVEVAALQEKAKYIAEHNRQLEERGNAPIKAKISFGDLTESADIELQAASSADLRRQVKERIEGRNEGLIFVEVDRSESIYQECTDRFTPLLESQTLKAVEAVNEAAAARAELDELSPKLSSAVQIIEALAARVKASDANLDESTDDLGAAVEILEAVAEEYKAERLRGVVEGIAGTNPSVDGLALRLCEARTPHQAVKMARTLIEKGREIIRESLPGREANLNEALDASAQAVQIAEQARIEREQRHLQAPQNARPTGHGAVMESTKRVVDRMKSMGGV
jgi:hypothetical protein